MLDNCCNVLIWESLSSIANSFSGSMYATNLRWGVSEENDNGFSVPSSRHFKNRSKLDVACVQSHDRSGDIRRLSCREIQRLSHAWSSAHPDQIRSDYPLTVEANSGSRNWYRRFMALQSLCPQTTTWRMSFTIHPNSRAAGSQLKYSSWKWWEFGITFPAFRTEMLNSN